MKVIDTRKALKIEVFDKPTEPITVRLWETMVDPINRNKVSIFDTTYAIETIIDLIITTYFYGLHNDVNKDYIINFESHILSSDWCTFASKRKLLNTLINELKLLDGSKKNSYELLLKKTISYRNAFAHGEISTDGRIVKLSYFEGQSKKVILNDDYFELIENDLNECYRLTNELYDSIRNKKPIVNI